MPPYFQILTSSETGVLFLVCLISMHRRSLSCFSSSPDVLSGTPYWNRQVLQKSVGIKVSGSQIFRADHFRADLIIVTFPSGE